ncbi:MAG TPA: Gfo/Idh/MocA family oxidoreductase [Pirellulaceae bacterium]|nr:Gfo/Idh/MocA family oxidoreductase [Pirellulaceae bacterium]
MQTRVTRRNVLQGALGAGAALALAGSPRWSRAAGTERIKVGQIGVGHAHATKLEVYRRSGDYEVVGVVEPDKELRERAAGAAAYRDLPWMTEEQLLNVSGLQAVLVETRVRDLLDTAGRCVAAGKHIHLDKPAGDSLPQYRALLDAAAKRKLVVQMGYMFRYSPAVVLMRKFLNEGWLGDVFEVHTVMSKVVPDGQRRELAEFKGGIMFELGCHVIDLVVGVLGRPERVHAFPRHSGPQSDGLADNMLAVLEYPEATASVKSSALEVNGGARRHFVVCGRSGTFHIQPLDAPNVTYTLDRDRGEYQRGTHEIKFGNYERYVGDAADMAKILRGEKECDFSYSHDLAVQETVLLAGGMPIV